MHSPKPPSQEPLISYETLLKRFKTLLKSNGLKFTRQREAILQTLYAHPGHYTPEALYRLVEKEHSGVKTGIATVYRTLTLLENAGLVTSISFGTQGKKI